MRRLLIPAALLALTAPAPATAATKSYVGKTDQGLRASAKVVDGDLKWLKVNWRADCKDPGYRMGPIRTNWVDRPDGPIEQTGRRFTDGGTRQVGGGEGQHKIVFEESLSGEILSGGVIKATHTVKARVYNSKGKQYDYCRGSIDIRLKR